MVWVLLFMCMIVITASGAMLYNQSQCDMVPLPDVDIYVINMDSAPGRLSRFKKRYESCSLASMKSIIRYRAVDGKRLNLTEHLTDKALYEVLRAEREGHRTKHYQLTRGGIGCYLSHIGLWHSILESDKDAALIFEDDVIMHRDLAYILSDMVIPNDTDIILLGYFCNACSNTSCGVRRVRKFYGLHGYIITRQGILKILNHPDLKPIGKQIDSWLSDLAKDGSLNIYATNKQFVVQDPRIKTSIQMVLKPRQGVDPWSST